ncbi:MAG: metallophosphatase family protein [Ignavibacteriae bacterium]|nr:metallophosphatase family protein [Ignavibacteriota bacterium]
MRLAIVSDIHSNLEALTTTLELIDSSNIDQTVCLGDIVGYGANPSECLALVQKRCSVVIMGNHDRAAVDVSHAENFTSNARRAIQWTNNMLSKEEKRYLQSLPYVAELDHLLLVHGSPYEPEEFHYVLSLFDAMSAMKHFTQRLCFIGHSHVPGIFSENGRVETITPNDRYLINVGSVGQPRDGNPMLSFGILDTDNVKYENIRRAYDTEAAAKKIIAAGLPPALGQRLMVGT